MIDFKANPNNDQARILGRFGKQLIDHAGDANTIKYHGLTAFWPRTRTQRIPSLRIQHDIRAQAFGHQSSCG